MKIDPTTIAGMVAGAALAVAALPGLPKSITAAAHPSGRERPPGQPGPHSGLPPFDLTSALRPPPSALYLRFQRYQRGSQSGLLSVNNIPVLYDPAHNIFHDKYMVIDSHLVLTGSFNFTTEAEYHNAENLIFVDSPQIAALYAANWLFHQAHCVA